MSSAEKSLSIYKYYIKKFSFDAPNSPRIFSGDGKPSIKFNITTNNHIISKEYNIYEIELLVDMTATLSVDKKDTVVLQMQFTQGGAFIIKGYSQEELHNALTVTCPGMLFPFVREVIATTAFRAGFPQLVVPPVDFELKTKHQ